MYIIYGRLDVRMNISIYFIFYKKFNENDTKVQNFYLGELLKREKERQTVIEMNNEQLKKNRR